MPKLLKQESDDKKNLGYMFWCVGCGSHHLIPVKSEKRPDVVWEFNNDMEKPSFKPSLLNRFETLRKGSLHICHLFITDGKIQYCGDCTHKYAHLTVDMSDAINYKSQPET